MSNGDRPSKPFSISFGSKSKPPAAKATPKKRTYATLREDDSSDDQDAPAGKAQLVHAFDHAAGGAVGEKVKEEQGPLIISAQKNLDWREEARKKRGGANLLPAEERARRAGGTQNDDAVEETIAPVYGLLITDKTQANEDVPMTEVPVEKEKPKTADEEALAALMGEKKTSSLVIEQAEQDESRHQTRTNDTNAFRADIAARPESASLADYEAVPIEHFGLALLRGQGYKPGDPIGRRKNAAPTVTRIPQKRANLLGIGAKEVPEGLEEFGAWGKGAKKGNRIDRSYNPLVLRNRTTGEVLTETELKAKQEQESIIPEDVPEKTPRRRRDYDDDRYGSSRQSSSRRDRSRSRDRKERRDRDYDSKYESSKKSFSRRDRSRSKDRKERRDRGHDRERRDREYEDRRDGERRDDRKSHRNDDRKHRDRR